MSEKLPWNYDGLDPQQRAPSGAEARRLRAARARRLAIVIGGVLLALGLIAAFVYNVVDLGAP